MSDGGDLASLEAELLGAIAAAGDEASLEAMRVGALGKKGSISERMKRLGALAPEERKRAGATLNALKEKVASAIAERGLLLKDEAIGARLAAEQVDVTLPAR